MTTIDFQIDEKMHIYVEQKSLSVSVQLQNFCNALPTRPTAYERELMWHILERV